MRAAELCPLCPRMRGHSEYRCRRCDRFFCRRHVKSIPALGSQPDGYGGFVCRQCARKEA